MKHISYSMASGGFTVVELIVVITGIGVLLAIAWGSTTNYLVFARDSERDSDVMTIARTFEAYYRQQSDAAVSGGGTSTYPTTSQATGYTIITRNDEQRIAPYQSGDSLIAATGTGSQTPNNASQYIYQPFTSSDALCTDTNTGANANTNSAPCVRFTLYYMTETGTLKQVESSHQQ